MPSSSSLSNAVLSVCRILDATRCGHATLVCLRVNHSFLLRAAGTHQRSILFPLGNQGYASIAKGNGLCSRVFLLILFILSCGGRFLLEQPQNSYLEVHPRMQSLFELFHVYFCQIWAGAYAEVKPEASSKRTNLWSNDEEMLVRLEGASGHLTRSQLDEFGRSLVSKRAKTDGTVGFSGNSAMKESQLLFCTEYGTCCFYAHGCMDAYT